MTRARLLRMLLVSAVVAGAAWLVLRPSPAWVDTSVVDTGDVVDSLEAEGRTRVRDRYVITSPIQGQARRLALDAGDPVAVGDVLVVLDPLPAPALDARSRALATANAAAATTRASAAREELAAAEVALAQQQREARRLEQLASSSLVARESAERARALEARGQREVAGARFRVATAQHELEAATAALALGSRDRSADAALELTAPVAGVVLRHHFESTRPVQPGDPLLEIGDPATMEVEVDVLSADAVKLREGLPVELHRWGDTAPLQGRVRRIEPAGFTKVSALGVEEQRVWVIVDISSQHAQWQRLGDAYRVNARFVLDQRSGVVRVPATALFRQGDGWAVFKRQSGRAVATTVVLGLQGGPWAEVLQGLAPGDEVVVHPGRDLEDGSRVRVR